MASGSASTARTRLPSAAYSLARVPATVDFPTPPLPDMASFMVRASIVRCVCRVAFWCAGTMRERLWPSPDRESPVRRPAWRSRQLRAERRAASGLRSSMASVSLRYSSQLQCHRRRQKQGVGQGHAKRSVNGGVQLLEQRIMRSGDDGRVIAQVGIDGAFQVLAARICSRRPRHCRMKAISS